MAKFGGSSSGMCALYMAIGAILGGILGELMKMSDMLAGLVPYLVTSYPVFDMAPVTLNLYVFRLTLGLAFEPNLMSILGVVLAVFIFRKYFVFMQVSEGFLQVFLVFKQLVSVTGIVVTVFVDEPAVTAIFSQC